MTGDNVLCKNWYLLGEKKIRATPTKQGLIHLRDSFKNFGRTLRPFYLGVSPEFPVAIMLMIRFVTACFGPYIAQCASPNDMVVEYNYVLSCCFTCWHNDIPWQLRKNYMNRMANVTLDKNNPDLHTDIPRLREGGVGAQVSGLEFKQLPRLQTRPRRLRV